MKGRSFSFTLCDSDGELVILRADTILSHNTCMWYAKRTKPEYGEAVAMAKSTRVQFFATGDIGLLDYYDIKAAIRTSNEIALWASDALGIVCLSVYDESVGTASGFAPASEWPSLQ